MRVLFTGQTGLDKKEIVEKLAITALEKRGLPKKIDDKFSKKFLQIFDIEGKIKERSGTPTLKTFLDSRQFKREELWNEEFKKMLHKISTKSPEHIFLIAHASYFRDNHYFTCLNLESLGKFNPTIIITLITDVCDICYEVNKRREEQGIPTKTKLSVTDVLAWRTSEIMLSRMLSLNIYGENKVIPHFIVSVKQSIEMLYKLLFDRELLRIYTGFPISNVRNDPSKVSEIGTYRKELNDRFIIFDPTTIDELRIFGRKLVPRLKLDPIEPMLKETGDKAVGHKKELKKLEEVIKNHIELRDYTCIDQSHLMTSYRPFWGGTNLTSMGLEKEVIHANFTQKEVYTVDPDVDNSGRPRNVFKSFEKAISCKDLHELIKCLDQIQKEKTKIFKKQSLAKTWE